MRKKDIDGNKRTANQFLRQRAHTCVDVLFVFVPPPPARRSGRPWRTMFTAGAAVCHCRVRTESEKVTTSDDVLRDDWVRRERAEHGAICALGLNGPGLIRLRFKKAGEGSLSTQNKQHLSAMFGRADGGKNASNLQYFLFIFIFF